MSKTTFNIRVADGPVQKIEVKTGIYRDAAAAVPALLGLALPIVVEIWHPKLVPEYGPYLYRIKENAFGGLVTEHCIRTHGTGARK
jgi:hypothetical protein